MRQDIEHCVTAMDSSFDTSGCSDRALISHMAFAFCQRLDKDGNLECCSTTDGETVNYFEPVDDVSTDLDSIEDVGPIWSVLFMSVCKKINGRYGVLFMLLYDH